MIITRTSPFTGTVNTMDLNVTAAQIAEFESPGRRMIQDIFPNLTADEREFIMTGITPQDWTSVFGGR